MKLSALMLRHDKRSEVVAVHSQESQKGNTMRVHSLFEPSRLERRSLQMAYERLVPMREHRISNGGAPRQNAVVRPLPRRQA